MKETYLTTRDYHMIQCIHEGLGNKEISAVLGISMRTVKSNKRRLFEKFGIDNRWDKSVRLVWLLSGGWNDTRRSVPLS